MVKQSKFKGAGSFEHFERWNQAPRSLIPKLKKFRSGSAQCLRGVTNVLADFGDWRGVTNARCGAGGTCATIFSRKDDVKRVTSFPLWFGVLRDRTHTPLRWDGQVWMRLS